VSSSSTSPPPGSAAKPVRRIAVFTHGQKEAVGDALSRAEEVAQRTGVEVVDPETADVDLVLALGGDGTMLRALRATLGTETPVFGVKFGRVGFLTSADGGELEEALEQVFAGGYRVVELCTLTARTGQAEHPAVNDVVATSSRPGRMVELGWEIAGERLGSQPCDGMICCTPSGSTAYNLSNGGPVMMWGLQAMAITFVAPHSLHARPIVVPRGLDLTVTNETEQGEIAVLVDGTAVGELAAGDSISVGIGRDASHLAVLPHVTFFGRYHEVFP
jgi:NAD+ kinase